MTDSEMVERMDAALDEIRVEIEARGGMLEIDKNPDLRWSGLARMPDGKLQIHTQKTGRQATAESKKLVAEALADITLEGRFIGRVLLYPTNSELEFPGGAHKPLDHSGIVKMFTAL